MYTDTQADGISLVLMKFIEGATFLELNHAPTNDERQLVLEQAAIINRMDYHPSYFIDSWAIPNIHQMFERVWRFIQPEDLKLVEEAIGRYEEIPVATLPHCFVHGDFTKANIMKGNDGRIYVLDFSVANWYPRIQEIAVIMANLLHDENSSLSLREKTELVAREYSTMNPLINKEKEYLYPYTLAGVAMEFMGAHQEKFMKGNDTEETEYWLQLGRNGLRQELRK